MWGLLRSTPAQFSKGKTIGLGMDDPGSGREVDEMTSPSPTSLILYIWVKTSGPGHHRGLAVLPCPYSCSDKSVLQGLYFQVMHAQLPGTCKDLAGTKCSGPILQHHP